GGRTGWAIVLATAGQVTHPAVVAPLAAALVAARLPWERDRARLLRAYAVSLLPVIPAAWLVFRSPVFQDSSTWMKVANFVTTLVPRSGVIVVPVALVALRRHFGRRAGWTGPAAVVVMAATLALAWRPLVLPFAWRSLWRTPDQAMVAFVRSPEFVPGATYRVLRVPDGKVGMYQLLQAGGRLDSEFFPESIVRRSWPGTGPYAEFL